ncbi:Uncharacterised protein [Segatella copri]|nr:Uncharacterised protein [Segatella copri]
MAPFYGTDSAHARVTHLLAIDKDAICREISNHNKVVAYRYVKVHPCFKWVVVSIYHIVKVSYRLIAIFLKSLVDSVQFLEKLVFLESFKAIFFPTPLCCVTNLIFCS